MSDLKKAFDQMNATLTEIPKPILEAAGHFAINIITLRTKKGLDADRLKFRPYSERYKPFRRRKQLQLDPVDLVVTGHMLGSMVPVVTSKNEVTIEFSGAKEIIKAIGNTGHGRDFFDVRAEADLDAIAEVVADELVETMLK